MMVHLGLGVTVPVVLLDHKLAAYLDKNLYSLHAAHLEVLLGVAS